MSGDLLLGIGIGALTVLLLGVIISGIAILILRTAINRPQAFIGALDEDEHTPEERLMTWRSEQHGGHA